jgi:hypothetical protein
LLLILNERKQQFWEATPSRQNFYVRELMNVKETQAKSTDKIQTANKRKSLSIQKQFDNNFCYLFL